MTDEQIKQAIIGIINDINPDEDTSNINPAERLRDQLDLDSMDFLDIVMELRKLYGLRRATVDRAMATVEAVLDGAPPEPDTADEPQDEAQGAAKSASFSGGRALTSE